VILRCHDQEASSEPEPPRRLRRSAIVQQASGPGRETATGVTRRSWPRRAIKGVVQSALSRVARWRYHLARSPVALDPPLDPSVYEKGLWIQTTDYVRYATLELICRQIRATGVPGSLAELGVFQGHFASAMATYLPDRRIYLFDTFAGFDDRDSAGDRSRGIQSRTDMAFGHTSVDSVVARMPAGTDVVPVIGWFPESAKGLDEERFCLVSIDADLYDPILAGLEWFVPRLERGGYILVHDFNSGLFPGVQRAVAEFARKELISLVPIPDAGGSCVICRLGKGIPMDRAAR
jgi:O-methyltransferase